MENFIRSPESAANTTAAVLVESDDTILSVNESYSDLFGYEGPAALVGRHISTIISKSDCGRMIDYGHRRGRGDWAPTHYDFAGLHCDGTLVWAHAEVTAERRDGRNLITTRLTAMSSPSTDRYRFTRLYDEHSPVVFALLLRMLPGAEAEEVLHDAFLQVWSEMQRYDPARGTEAGWIISIARSRALDRLRSSRRRQRLQEAAPPPRLATDVEVPIIASIDGASLRTALDGLSEAQRQVLNLSYFAGLSQSEIAKTLGLPLGTVKSRMLLGIRHLRELHTARPV